MVAAGAAAPGASPETPPPTNVAPPGTPDTRYYLRVGAFTGSRIEQIRCWTRAQWADQGVDVDKEWPEEGVAVKG